MVKTTNLFVVLLGCSGHGDSHPYSSPGPAFTSQLKIEPLRKWLGGEMYDEAGRSLATDDWDGDGRAEVIIGAPSTFVYGTDAVTSHGAVYRVSEATPDGVLDNVSNGTLVGSHNGDYFGMLLAASGNVLGGPEPDLAIQGGISEDPWVALGIYSGPLEGTHTYAELHTLIENVNLVDGAADVARCGDLDGDGHFEFCVSADAAPPESALGGDRFVKTYIFRGPLPVGTIQISSAEVQLVGITQDVGGYGLEGGIDFTGDGLTDLFVGADDRDEGRGGVFVVSDPPNGLVEVVDYPLWAGDQPGDQAGRCAVGGDLDGDGTGDVYVGAHQADALRGRAYVITAPSGGRLSDSFLQLKGTNDLDSFGIDAAIGDLDGDGASDLAVGIPRNIYFGLDRPGRVAVYLGPLAPGVATEADANLVVRGSDAPDAFGRNLIAANTDGDGDDELVVAATHDSAMGDMAGAVYLLDPFASLGR